MGLMSWLRGGRSADALSEPGPGGLRPDRPDRVDVNRLAPVQRSVTGQDLLINPAGFEAGLTTRHIASLGTPLGHLVSPEAPAGLVRGVVDAAPGNPPPPVQRAVEMPMPARRGTWSVAVQRAYGDSPPSLTSAGPAAVSAGLPVRQLVGEQPLVRADQHTDAVGAAPEPDAPGAVPGTRPGTAPVQRTADGAPPVPPSLRRVGGLGAPLPGLPPTAQRRAVEPGEPPAPQVQHAPRAAEAGAEPEARDPQDTAPDPQDTAAEPEGTAPEPETVAPLLGDAPLTPAATDAPVPPPVTGQATGGPESGREPAAPVQRAATAPVPPPVPSRSRPTAPLLGDRPLSLRTAPAPGDAPAGGEAPVQREPQRAGSDGSGPRPSPFAPAPASPSPFAPAPPSPPPAVAVRWTGPDEGPAPGTPAAPLQRAVAPVQRQTAPSPARPGAVPGRGPRVPASVRNAGAVAVAAGVAQRMADGSVVFPSAPRDGTSRPVVQRDSETAEEPPPPPLPEPDPEPGPDPEPPTAEQPPTTTTSTSPDGTPQAPPVTDELVRALYTPLSRLLKADLRLERERSGFLINTRH
ncbi:hypothetical protein OHR86_31810 [Streptomyces sp. NBC_00441]|uniref:hypothetical protein n=1 Tax=Streptomyces sp. NBC_00441 TaxID=2975742 RepID=UPI002E27FB65|nr:hypothetical protein [Streptomyces sp. NBC_00441]